MASKDICAPFATIVNAVLRTVLVATSICPEFFLEGDHILIAKMDNTDIAMITQPAISLFFMLYCVLRHRLQEAKGILE